MKKPKKSNEPTFEPPVEDPIEEEKQEKENLLFKFIDSINKTKFNMMADPDRDPDFVEKEYKRSAYVINRALSLYPDTIFHAQEMNMRSSLDGKPQYLYYLNAVSKRTRFPPKGSKWFTTVHADNLDIVKQYYNYSTKKALEALQILTDEDIAYIKQRLNTGGIVRNKSPKKKE